MKMAYSLPLDGIIDVTVNLAPVSAPRVGYNTLLIVGGSSNISVATRVKSYASIAEMTADGWANTAPEYMTASLYFAQQPRPAKVFIGRIDTADETLVDAIAACREADGEWYAVTFVTGLIATLTASATDITAVADFVEVMTPEGIFAFSITDSDMSFFTSTIAALAAGSYKRTFVQYTSAANAEDYAKTPVAGIIGYALGSNTPGVSAYTLAYKGVAGIAAEQGVTSAKLDQILNDYKANIYLNQAVRYNIFRQGKMVNGQSFDEVLFLDMLVYDVKNNVMDLLVRTPKLPQTESGVNQLYTVITAALESYAGRNFLFPGVWAGEDILNLKKGDTLSKGYMIQFEALEDQSTADREARKAPLCYVSLKLAGAIEHVTIAITVNR
jgi:hypothetical protein